MKGKVWYVISICLLLLCFREEDIMAQKVKSCSGANFWFPGNQKELKKTVEKYLEQARTAEVEGTVQGVISPHAGYRYCGEIMGSVYKRLRGKTYDRVIFLAFSHSYPVKDISVLEVDGYETPLGTIPVDTELRDTLLQHELVTPQPPAHAREHSAENQFPFLQVVLEPGWKMVSIFVGDLTEAEFDKAAEIIRPFVDEKTLIVTSSDFTHYGSQYGYVPFTENVKENMRNLDGGAAEKIIAKDPEGFRQYVKQTGATICGKNPIVLMLKILSRKAEGKLVEYTTSGDITGDYDMAVGYAGIVFYLPATDEETSGTQAAVQEEPSEQSDQSPVQAGSKQKDEMLSEEERKVLLRLSRDALKSFLKSGTFKPDLSEYELTPRLKEKAGVFVTLKSKGRLRGCIGYVEGIKPLWQAVIDNTHNAAFEDPRFPPVSMKEFDDISIEISVMTPLRPIESIEEIEVGTHGLVIEKGFHRGLLLPQVPTEWGWDRDEFLEHICRKAGLPPDAWKDPDAQLKVFSAQVFSEKEYAGMNKDK